VRSGSAGHRRGISATTPTSISAGGAAAASARSAARPESARRPSIRRLFARSRAQRKARAITKSSVADAPENPSASFITQGDDHGCPAFYPHVHPSYGLCPRELLRKSVERCPNGRSDEVSASFCPLEATFSTPAPHGANASRPAENCAIAPWDTFTLTRSGITPIPRPLAWGLSHRASLSYVFRGAGFMKWDSLSALPCASS
jgi:hypothetical protein